MAIDFIPHFIARLIRSFAGVIPSIVLICVCICNSTLLTFALSVLVAFFSSGISTIVFAKTPSCFAYGSNCAVPDTLTFAAFFSLFLILSTLSAVAKILQSIVFVPSYMLNTTKNLPFFNSLVFIPKFISSSFGSSSTFSILPSKITFPLSTPISCIFVIGSFKLRLLP